MRALVGAAFVLPVGCSLESEPLENTGESESLLINGAVESDAKFPWVVHLSGNESCHGVLIHPRWVLTAAHCLSSSFGGLTVSYSRTDPKTGVVTGGRQDTGQKSTFPHPAYDGHPGHDIGLVRLPAEFAADPLLVPAALPMRRAAVGQTGLVAGNGTTEPGKVMVLNGSVGFEGCGRVADELCITAPATQVCHGDSGSGVITREGGVSYVTGITANGKVGQSEDCAKDPTFSATDVMQYLDWLTATMGASTVFTAGYKPSTQLYASNLDFGLPSTWESITGDFDGDGKGDYARVGSTGAFLFYGGVGGTFTPGFQTYNGLVFGLPSSWQTITGDFNGDGRKDYARLGDTGAWVFYGNANRSFTAGYQAYSGLAFGVPSPWQVTTGDFNGDGKTDYARLGTTGAFVFFGNANGTFTTTFQNYDGLAFGAPSPWQVVSGDFNGDGRADYARLGDTGAFVYFGNANKTFTSRFQSYDGLGFGAPSSWKAITGDFNGDGRADYARLGDTGAWFYYGTSSQGFTRAFQNYDGLAFGLPTAWQTITGDFNGDGKTDYARLGSTGSFFYFGTSSRTFTSLFHEDTRNFGIPSPFSPIAADFNGDGKTDYARLGGAFAEVFTHD